MKKQTPRQQKNVAIQQVAKLFNRRPEQVRIFVKGDPEGTFAKFVQLRLELNSAVSLLRRAKCGIGLPWMDDLNDFLSRYPEGAVR